MPATPQLWRRKLTLGHGLPLILAGSAFLGGSSVLFSPDDASPDRGQNVRPPLHLTWVRPESVSAMERESEAVVYGKVEQVKAGPPLTNRRGEAVLPTQRVVFSAITIAKGSLPQEFEVFRTGDDRLPVLDDPEYVVGERYLLFLRRFTDSPEPLVPVAPDGRLLQDREGRVVSAIAGGAASKLSNRTLRDALQTAGLTSP